MGHEWVGVRYERCQTVHSLATWCFTFARHISPEDGVRKGVTNGSRGHCPWWASLMSDCSPLTFVGSTKDPDDR